MCGPFAVLATSTPSTGTRSSQANWTLRLTTLASYHIGRLATYLMLGALMGGLGNVADGLAVGSGWAPIAARWVGGLMVVMGLAILVKWWRGRPGLVQHAGWVARWTQGILQVRKRWRVRSASGAAFSWGLISTWLPCGWLYVLAIAAAGAGGVAWGMLLMTAFWVGTLPLLSMVPLGAWWITGRVLSDEAATEENPHVKPIGWNARLKSLVTSVQSLVQPAAACILIAFGVLTATGRAEISLANLKAPDSNAAQIAPSERLKEATDQPLPCAKRTKQAPTPRRAMVATTSEPDRLSSTLSSGRPLTQPCSHCGLPTCTDDPAAFMDTSSRILCCHGCMGAYALIHECGLQDFYALRDQSHSEISLVKSVRKQHVLNDLEAAGVPVETFSDGLCRVQLAVDGLHCAACSWLIEKMRGTVPGLKSARVRMSDGTLDMVYDPQVTNAANVAERLGRLGYVLSPIDSHDDCESADRMLQRDHWIGMATSFFLAANAVWIGISLYAGEAHLYSRQSTRIDRATGRRLEKCRPGHSRLFCSFAPLQHHHHFFSKQWLDSSADRGFIHAAEWDHRPDDGVVGPHIQDQHPS